MGETKDYQLLNKLTFKTKSFRKNFDLTSRNDNFVTEFDGKISKLNITEQLPPTNIGEYSITTWNFGLASKLDVNLIDLMRDYINDQDTYPEVLNLIDDGGISLDGTKKLALIHDVMIRPKFRKKHIINELVEFIYRDYYLDKSTVILFLVKPFQSNAINFNYYMHQYVVKENLRGGDDSPHIQIPAHKYFELEPLIEEKDLEMVEYKLFSIAVKSGLSRVGSSYIFRLQPTKVLNAIKKKRSEFNEVIF